MSDVLDWSPTMVEIGRRAGTDCADQRAAVGSELHRSSARLPRSSAGGASRRCGWHRNVGGARARGYGGWYRAQLARPADAGQLNADTVFGPSYSRLVKTGLDDATAKGIARWGGAVFFISNHLAEAREQMAWHDDDRRAVERRKAKDAIDTRVASRLAGRWGGTEGAQSLRNQVYDRANNAPKPDRRSVNARLAVATLEGRLNYLLLTGGSSSRSAIGLAALLDARGWGETTALVAGSGLVLPGCGATKVAPEARAKAWLNQLAGEATHQLVRIWRSLPPPSGGLLATATAG